MAGTDAIRDGNFIPVALGVSSSDATATSPFTVDPATGRLQVFVAGDTGDVIGPASSTDNAIARFDGTTGKLIQNSVVTIADTTGNTTGIGTLNTAGRITITQGTADTTVLSASGYSVTGSGTTSMVTWTGTTNTSGAPVVFAIDLTDTTSSSTSLAMRIRGGTTATNTLFAVSMGGGILLGTTQTTAQTKLTVSGSGGLNIQTNAASNTSTLTSVADNVLQMGLADNTTTVIAQTFRSQGAATGGGNNVAGQNWTFIASPGKGTGAGGSFIFQTAPAGVSGNTQNTPVTALTIDSTGIATALGINLTGSTIPANGIYLSSANILGFSANSGRIFTAAAAGISGNNAAAAFISATAASATVPSLVPNRADTTTGWGAQASGNISAVIGGAEQVRFISTGLTIISGKDLVLGNAAVTGLTPGALAALTTATIVIKDSTGQAYRIPCVI